MKQLYVKHSTGTKENLEIVEPHLMTFGAVPRRPGKDILLEPDGTGEIRVYGPDNIVKQVLEDHGFEIVREVEME